MASFEPDVLFNPGGPFKNNRGFDQNIVSLLESKGFRSPVLARRVSCFAKHKGISKKILGYHHIHVPNFVVIPRGQRIARLKRQSFRFW